MVKVSVIVPVFNAEKYIKRCLNGLIYQTLKEIEIICIDDGSTDESAKILQEYEQLDNRIMVYTMEENQGAAICRNTGLNLAQGKYIQFVDADDYIDQIAIESLYEKAELYGSDMCFFKFQSHQENDSTKNSVLAGIKNTYDGVYTGKDLMLLFLKNEEFFLYACLVFYKKKFLDDNKLRFKNLMIGEGGDMILRCLYIANVSIVDNRRYYHYCRNTLSVTHRDKQKIQTLIGQIYQYVDMMRILVSENDSKVLELFLRQQYNKIRGGISCLSKEDEENIEGKLEDGFSRSIFHMLIAEKQFTYLSELGDQEIVALKRAHYIIIFGAGYASRDIIELLNQYKFNILGFAVSDTKKNPSSLFGHPVYGIHELLDYRKEALVVVAANKKYHEEIKLLLEGYGFLESLFLDIQI